MGLRSPTEDELESLSKKFFLDLSEQELSNYKELITEMKKLYDTIGSYEEKNEKKDSEETRDPGCRIEQNSKKDRYNTWITECHVNGAGSGPLSGWRVGVKDNIAVRGVEMTCGSRVMEGYVPGRDATGVKRVLSAGATVVGKTNMDDMAFSGNGHSSAFGPTLNPHDEERLAGGSSGGSAIAVQQNDVDMALGTDQAGSVRVPAAWSGIVGLKPTHGLVPYTGMIGIENTIDHCGPLARDVTTTAQALSVLAGYDPADPRQMKSIPSEKFENNLTQDASELSVAVVEEGFNRPGCESDVNDKVNSALELLEDMGTTVESVSVPMHADAMDIYTAALAEGFVASINGEGAGHNWKGEYNTEWITEFGKARRELGGRFPPTVKLTLLLGGHAKKEMHSSYYAQAMNLRNRLTENYNELLEEFDVVAMPTTPMQAHKHKPNANIFEFIDDAWKNLANTCIFNMTGHPSISVPVQEANKLPVGLMISGKHFDDSTVLGAGKIMEDIN